MGLNSELISEAEKNLFPGARESEIIELINKMKRLVPWDKSDSEKVRYLLDIITYVDGMINGDEFIQYTTQKYTTKFAKKALQELIDEIHGHILESYRSEVNSLRAGLDKLYEEHRILSSGVLELEGQKKTLQADIEKGSQELSELRATLQYEKENGMSRVRSAISSERERLEAEITSLNEEKQNLSAGANELKELFNSYSSLINRLISAQEGPIEVVWQSISEDHPIYNTSYLTIDAFVQKLKLEYMEKTGSNEEQCKHDFSMNCPDLKVVSDFLNNYFNNPKIDETSSLAAVINFDKWDEKSSHRAKILKAMLKNMKLPEYTHKIGNIDTISLTTDSVPDNINGMLRELHLRRVAAEAISKQRIAEAELQTVLGILKSVLPQDYDLSILLNQYDGYREMIELKGSIGQLKGPKEAEPEEHPKKTQLI